MTLEELKQTVEDLIVKNRIGKIFELMNQYLTNDAKREIGLILLKSEVRRKEDAERKGLILAEEIEVFYNKTYNKVLNILEKLTISDILADKDFDERNIYDFVVVITTTERENKLRQLLTSLRFKKVEFYNDYKYEYVKHAVIIIFDNMDLPSGRNLSENQNATIKSREAMIQKCLDETAEQYLIHYGNYLQLLDSNRDRMQGANSQFSLYARVKEVIEFSNTINN